MRRILLLITILAMMLAVSPVFASVYFLSDFNGDTLANTETGSYPTPVNWIIGSGLTKVMCPDMVSVVDADVEFAPFGPQPPDLKRVFRIHDPDGANVGYPAHVSHSFAGTTSGTVTLTFDLLFVQDTSAFIVSLCSDQTASAATAWASMLIFEGNEAWAAPAQAGSMSYCSFYNTGGPTLPSTYNKIPDITYSVFTWYTVRMEADMDTKKWRAFMGLKGSDLMPVLDWTDFIYTGNPPTVPATQKVTRLAQVLFKTSNKAGLESNGIFYVDNVKVDGPVTAQTYSTIHDARLADKGAFVQLTDKTVTAGSDQLGNGLFYIQDDANGGAGIRVRSGAVVHEGDRVDLTGFFAQTSEGGVAVNHNGEREIQTDNVTVNLSHDPVVKPVYMRNSEVGGGWFGPQETVTGGPEPRLKGVWPYNGYNISSSTYANTSNSFTPLFNVGTLVKVAGVVTRLCSGESKPYPDIYISDGSLLWDGMRTSQTTDPVDPLPSGIRIKITSEVAAQLPAIAIGDRLSVTGIVGAVGTADAMAGYTGTGIRNIRIIRVRKPGDVVKL